MTIANTRLNRLLKTSYHSVVLSFVFAFPLLLLGCPSSSNKPIDANPSANTPSAAKSDFDGDRAFEHVRKQVEFGPRPAGSAELEKARGSIVDQLKSYGLKISTDEFHATTPLGDRKMVNVTAELPGESSEVIVIGSHYDTKYFKEFKFVGANDGGASTGALMEVARVMALKGKPRMTYWFVFFDGEEAFCTDWDECHNPNPADPKNPLPDNLYGSRHYVAQLVEKNELKRVRAMILFDMMGYKNLRLGRDDLSTTWLQDIVWQTGKQLGYGQQFVDAREGVGDDDHAPFLRAGIPALDIIQLSTYKSSSGDEYWHTKEDTLDKVSAKSLKIAGDAVIVSFPKIEERLQNSSR
jgi:glutaminyl-peptide cyclotransferase